MSLRETDIVHENGPAWVLHDRARSQYTVLVSGATHSTSDSAYEVTDDGLSVAKARADYLAGRAALRSLPAKRDNAACV